MDVGDVIVTYVGSFGKYQKWNCFLLGIVGFFLSWYSLDLIFVVASPKHWCTPPDLNGTKFEDLNYEAKKIITVPKEESDDRYREYSWCRLYDLNFSDPEIDISYHDDGQSLHPSVPTKKCNKWTYDHSAFETTAVTEVSEFNCLILFQNRCSVFLKYRTVSCTRRLFFCPKIEQKQGASFSLCEFSLFSQGIGTRKKCQMLRCVRWASCTRSVRDETLIPFVLTNHVYKTVRCLLVQEEQHLNLSKVCLFIILSCACEL